MTPPRDEDDATSPYPQLNLNTGMSLATVGLLIGMVIWSVSVKGDVSSHEQRLTRAEAGLDSLRVVFDNARQDRSQAETKLEGRLVAIEVLLRDMNNRIGDRRKETPP